MFYEWNTVGRTIAGLPILMLTISDQKPKKKFRQKKCVVISAWVHPNETNSSFVFEGLLRYVVSNEAKPLWMLYNFYLFPCLNPDGVEGGFYRANLSGFDLNRTWLTPHKLLHPSIFIIKDFL